MHGMKIQAALLALTVLLPQGSSRASAEQPTAIPERGKSEVAPSRVLVRDTGKLTDKKWLEAYLAREMQYDQQQIEQFKRNVADMPDSELKAMLRRIKYFRPFQDQRRQLRLAAHRSNLERLAAAKRAASARPMRAASYNYGSQQIRTYERDPQRQSLFGGYFVELGVGLVGVR